MVSLHHLYYFVYRNNAARNIVFIGLDKPIKEKKKVAKTENMK